MPVRRLASIASILALTSWGGFARAAQVSIAIDIDTSVVSTQSSGQVSPTQTGFQSWNISHFDNQSYSTGPLTTGGVTFELLAGAPGMQFSFEPIAAKGSRNRQPFGGGGGGPYNDLLTDFAFAEALPRAFLALNISGLPLGKYRMASWHYDSLLASPPDLMQIEVGNLGATPGLGASLVVDSFLLGQSPRTFVFEVTSPGQVKHIVFRNDNPDAGRNGTYRTRLNGFTLTSVPEPSDALLITLASACAGAVRRRPRR